VVSPDGTLVGAVNTMVDVTAIRDAERARWRSETFAQHILASSPDCIKVLDLEGRLQSINACGCVSLEIDDPSKARGLSYFDFWNGAERDAAVCATQEALATGSGRFSGTYKSSSGRVTVWDEIVTTLPDEQGRPSAYVVVSRDMTAHHQESLAMARRLSQQGALATIGSIALSERDFGVAMQKIVELLADAVGCTLAKILQFADHADHLILRAGVGWKDGLVGSASVGIDRESQAGFTLMAGEPVVVKDLESETRFNGPALLREHGVRSGMSTTISGSAKRPFGVLGVHSPRLMTFQQADVDFLVAVANVIAARWRQEEASERRALLVKEMSHRTGNLLQLANSVFLQTLRFTPDVDKAKDIYSQRLAAMARTNMMISKDGWGKASIKALAEEALEPFSGKVRISGRDLALPADLCFDLGMIWHELSTNSAKYGAFGREDGGVDVSWSLAAAPDGTPQLSLIWQDISVGNRENGRGTGFGMKLLSHLVERKHSGTIEIEDAPNYKCAITMKIETPK
jgi:two-component sensor histidine kinase